MEETYAGKTLDDFPITNPHYSKLLDVHRFSEHPNVSHLTKQIWAICYGEPESSNPRKGGVRPKANSFAQLRAILLDLFVAWDTDPELSIGVAMSNTAWSTGSRYNKIGMSRLAPKIIHRLHEVGYISLAAGSYTVPGANSNRTTRIRAAEPLRQMFRDAKFGPQHILTHPGKECILMRSSEKSERNIEYKDTPVTDWMRADLMKYNGLLLRTFIDIPDQEDTFIERPIKSGARAGEITRVPICGFDNFVHRVFNRNDWSCGGRFYGGWWQSVGSEVRKRIHINDEPTVEVDYQALHVAILAAKRGVKLEGDPYELDEQPLPDLDNVKQRKLVKLLILMALNAKNERSAYSAFRDASPVGSMAKSMKNAELRLVLDAAIKKHPFLEDDLCADRGITLMNLDSLMASMVIRHFTRQKIPVLCIHDSFLIGYSYAIRLKTAMNLAAKRVLGCPVALSNNYLGLDEVERSTPSLVDDYMDMRHLPRTHAYRVRQRIFSERLAYLESLGG
ncbi:hypothetical protein [Ruegeria sp. HKCCA5426]|uniref:hypothetical protein n=1 Tax=Ruegeria sp. HKCCA5426 TaxID=2682985 RepID=UPI0014886A55|nr:hypothetical protein [Ruegeria sp. HKCCA5426]